MAQPAPVEYFATPDEHGPLLASELHNADLIHKAVDAGHLVQAGLLALAAILLFLIVRRLAIGRIGRLLALWLDAKERELRRQHRTPD